MRQDRMVVGSKQTTTVLTRHGHRFAQMTEPDLLHVVLFFRFILIPTGSESFSRSFQTLLLYHEYWTGSILATCTVIAHVPRDAHDSFMLL